MKKYNRPEIEALALENVDIMAVSSSQRTQDALNKALSGDGSSNVLAEYGVAEIGTQIADLNSKYTW